MLPLFGWPALGAAGRDRRSGGSVGRRKAMNRELNYGDQTIEAATAAVRGLGRTELVGSHQVGHDPQHPLHQGAAPHADPGELADHAGLPIACTNMRAILK